MKTVTSVSGGRTSAYIAANYPFDYLLFALVRIEDEKCRFKDEKIRRLVEDRIQAPFIATAEDDTIIYTMLDLEQYIGKPINWVTGLTFDEVVRTKGGWLPNKLHRYCTHYLKIDPMFYWWAENIGEPVNMQIGFRANETKRANDMLSKTNADGFIEFQATFEKHETGKHKGLNKWEFVPWQRPSFPLIEDGIYKQDVTSFWKNKPVRFADYNNCIGCFHRNSMFLRFQYEQHREKMLWFESKEGGENGYWKSEKGLVIPYKKIREMSIQGRLFSEDFEGCPDGFCSL